MNNRLAALLVAATLAIGALPAEAGINRIDRTDHWEIGIFEATRDRFGCGAVTPDNSSI